MLTIQPQVLNSSRPAFKANEKFESSFNLAEMDEDTYQSARSELLETKKELEDLANNEEFKLPKNINKAIKVGTIGASLGVAAMAGGFGAGKFFDGMKKLFDTKFIKNISGKISEFSKFALKKLSAFSKKLVNSPKLQKITNSISEAYEKFGTKKFGKPVVNVLNKIGKGIKFVYNKVAGAVKFVYNKSTSVKAETYRAATVNTVGASSGIATGVNMLREKKESEEN